MADIKDPAYLYVGNPDHPAFGQTIEMEMSDFKKHAKALKEGGIRPATGEELAPVQRDMEKQIAGEATGTAAALGALRGSTFGLSDVALERSGIAEKGSLSTLERENPKASLGGEIGGALLTGGVGALKGGAAVAKSIPNVLGRRVAAGASSAGLYGAGSELGRQAREDDSYDFGKALDKGVDSGLVGATLPLAGAAVKPLAGMAFRKGMGAVEKAAGGASNLANKFDDLLGKYGSGAAEKLPPTGLLNGAGASLGAGVEAVHQLRTGRFDVNHLAGAALAGSIGKKALSAVSVKRLAPVIRDMAKGAISSSNSRKLAQQVLTREANALLRMNPHITTKEALAIAEGALKSRLTSEAASTAIPHVPAPPWARQAAGRASTPNVTGSVSDAVEKNIAELRRMNPYVSLEEARAIAEGMVGG